MSLILMVILLVKQDNMNLQFLCTQVTQIVIQTGKFIKQQQSKISLDRIETKGLNDFVTFVDKESETRLVNFLKPLIQKAGFITEEGTIATEEKEYTWIIDPLDGTTNFIHGLSPFAISVALQHQGKTIMGIVYEISLDELFYAYDGKPAHLNDRLIHVSHAASLQQSLIATGFPYSDFSQMNEFLESMNYLMQNTHGMRRLGSAATDLAYVACGRFEGFYEYGLKPWDVAAGAYILEKAGGIISDFSQSDNYVFGEEIIASNQNIYPEFVKIIQKFLKSQPNAS
jgi:myo-inositol-1(or 4)-monophosphatase